MRRASAAFAICIAASLLCASVDAVVACNTGFVEFACPDDYPTCCSWKRNGVIAACCPARSICELEEGECLITNTSSSGNVTKAPQQGGITVGVSEAAAFITFAAIGFIVGLVGCAFLGFRTFLFFTDRRARRQEAERQALLQGSDDEAAGNGDEDEDSEVDDEGQCNICYSRSVNCALMPCAHVATCRVCAARLDKCPICREEVVKFVAFKTRLYRALPKPERASPRRDAALAADMKTEELGTNRAPSASSAATPVSPGRAVNVNGDGADDERDERDDASAASAGTPSEPTVAADEPEAQAAADTARAASTAEPEAANGTGDTGATSGDEEVAAPSAAAPTSTNGSPREADESA